MQKPQVIVINGPAGVGKTTISRDLQARLSGTVCVHGDDLRQFAPDDAANFLGPGSTYRAGAALALSYLEMGATRVIFDYVFTRPEQIALFRDGLSPEVRIRVFTLWAPLPVVLRREATRVGREPLGGRVTETHAEMKTNLDRLGTIITNEGNLAKAVDMIVGKIG